MAISAQLEQFMAENGFQNNTESSRRNSRQLGGSQRGAVRVAFGAARDADIVVAGTRTKFEVRFGLEVRGKDLAIPAVEGIVTLGVASAVDLHAEHRLEEKVWRDRGGAIDPTVQICGIRGLIFRTPQDLKIGQGVGGPGGIAPLDGGGEDGEWLPGRREDGPRYGVDLSRPPVGPLKTRAFQQPWLRGWSRPRGGCRAPIVRSPSLARESTRGNYRCHRTGSC